jgi:ectoine hydroxylase-related dioxygenase (phytanoyl-CoA dioxygenase family)
MLNPALVEPDALTFAHGGAQRFRSAIDRSDLRRIEKAITGLRPDQAGIRLHGVPLLEPILLNSGRVGTVAAGVLGNDCRAVRAILFDKTPATNWQLGWHQDRTIAVVTRIDVDGFGPWTCKQGLVHVEPPFSALAGMSTLRVHLDPVSMMNAPLLIAPGSHRYGRIPQADVARVVRECGTSACLADAGDVWLYATPILHASDRAREPRHRRVLQVDYAIGELPGGLQWRGI